MSRLTAADRDRLAKQLNNALVPDRHAEITALREAAYRAVLVDFYTPAGLKRIATLPPHWLQPARELLVRPTGRANYSMITIENPPLVPGKIPHERPLGEAAQAAVDRWADVTNHDAKLRDRTSYEVRRVLDRATTLEQLLTLMPAARGILSLPPAAEPDAIAASINQRLADRTPEAAPAKPAAPKRIRKRTR